MFEPEFGAEVQDLHTHIAASISKCNIPQERWTACERDRSGSFSVQTTSCSARLELAITGRRWETPARGRDVDVLRSKDRAAVAVAAI